MANAIDLCRVSDVRAWLGLNPSQAAVVSTTIAASIAAGTGVTVTPTTMANIQVGSILQVDSGTNAEIITPSIVTPTTFVANFALPHTGPVTLLDITDQILGRVITMASLQWMRKLGLDDKYGTPVTQSPLAQVVSYDERYDGNGGQRLFLRKTPIRSVTLLTVNGTTIGPSDGNTTNGYLIDQSRKSISLPCPGTSRAQFAFGQSQRFYQGIQNVHVVYTAGWDATPDDIIDSCIEMVALNYKRRNYLDEASQSKPDSIGAIRFRDWEVTPKIQAVMDYYSRRAAV